MASIAAQYNVSTNTISRRITSLGQGTQPAFNGLPTMLCIDEFRLVNKWVLLRRVPNITVLPWCKNADIKNFFLNCYSKRHRERVTRVVMDFNSQYQPALRTLFPHAKLIVDNLHLVQMAVQALNQTRVQLIKNMTTDGYQMISQKVWTVKSSKPKEQRMITRTGKPLFIEFGIGIKIEKRNQFVNKLVSKYNFVNTGWQRHL